MRSTILTYGTFGNDFDLRLELPYDFQNHEVNSVKLFFQKQRKLNIGLVYRAQADIKYLQELLGHNSSRTTETYFSAKQGLSVAK